MFLKHRRKIFLFIFFFTHALFYFSQDKTLLFTTRIEINGKGAGGAQVTITQNGKPYQTITTNDDGKVKVSLPAGYNYQFVVTKPQYCTKRFDISTIGIPPDGRDQAFDVTAITLFQPVPGIDYSVLNKPLFKAVYNASSGGMDYDEAYANMMLSELQRLKSLEQQALNAAKERENNYKNAIANGDKSFQKKEWQTAIAYYNEALKYKPDENYPKDQIAHINKLIAEEEARKKAEEEAKAKARAELEAKYNAAIKRGDEAFNKKDWNNAKAAYNEALTLKPNEAYPKNQLAAIDKAIAEEAAAKAKAEAEAKAKAELEAKYNAAIKRGDEAFNKKDWNNAKSAYNEALTLKPNEAYPRNQLAAIDKAIAEEAAAKAKADAEAKAKAELEAKYNAAIKKGDEAFNKKDWNNAKAAYNEALTLKPNEAYPRNQLAAIDKAIAEEAAAKAKADAEAKAKAELEAKYNAAIKRGDEAFAKKDWNNAKSAYNEALTLKPNEAYPRNQLAAIDKAIAEEAAAKAKAEAEAKAKAELEAKYNAAIKRGDEAFAKKDWNNAKAAYNEALTLKPNEAYPKNQLAAIDKAIAEEAAAKAKAEAEAKARAELEAKYNAAIKRGDDAFAKKDWNNAKSAYNEALTLKPNEAYPKNQLAAIDKAIAEEAAAKAKAEAEAKARAELETKYNAAIKRGDDAFAKKDWNNAKSAYNEALTLKPNEAYPKNQLAAIDKAIAEEAAAKAKAEAEAKARAELEAKYNAAIKRGDEAFAKKDWNNAKAAYNEALTLKPNEAYPKNQLAAIDKAIAEEAAAKAKAEAEAKAKAELEAKYNAAIKRGDEAFAKKDWNNAKAAYNEALTLKPNETYPKNQLAAIDKAIAEEAAAKAKAEAEAKARAELEAKYNAAIKRGDEAFAKKDWNNAKAAYNEALTLKPNETYPKNQLAAIDKAIADEAAAKAKADADAKAKAELEAKYIAAIKRGDEAFTKKDWNNAKTAYNEALTLKPNEAYPKNQLAAIDKAIAEEAAAKAKADADAKARAELEAKYNAAIKNGDLAFGQKKWQDAKKNYEEALSYKPNEKYPSEQIKKIEKILEDEEKKKAMEEDQKYKSIITRADNAFNSKDWITAKTTYQQALELRPQESYPKKRIEEIEEILKKQQVVKQNEIKDNKNVSVKPVLGGTDYKYQEAIKSADKYFSFRNFSVAKRFYQEALVYKPEDSYARERLQECEKQINADENELKRKRKQELLAKYKEGVTEETILGNGVVITQRVVVRSGDVWVYQKKSFTWGSVVFYRDEEKITESEFEFETKP